MNDTHGLAAIDSFYLVYLPVSQCAAYDSYLGAIARACAVTLTAVGVETRVDNQTIVSPGISVGIVRGCDGMEMMTLFVAAVVAFPARLRSKVSLR